MEETSLLPSGNVSPSLLRWWCHSGYTLFLQRYMSVFVCRFDLWTLHYCGRGLGFSFWANAAIVYMYIHNRVVIELQCVQTCIEIWRPYYELYMYIYTMEAFDLKHYSHKAVYCLWVPVWPTVYPGWPQYGLYLQLHSPRTTVGPTEAGYGSWQTEDGERERR